MGAQRCQVTCSRSPSIKGQNRDSNSALPIRALDLTSEDRARLQSRIWAPNPWWLRAHWSLSHGPLATVTEPHIPDAPWHGHLCPPGIPSRPCVSLGQPQPQSTWSGACTQAHTQVGPSSQGIPRGGRDGKGVGLGESIWVLGQSPPQVTSAKSRTQPRHFLAISPLATLPSLGAHCPALQRGSSFPPCPALGSARHEMRVEVHFNLWSAHLPFYPSCPRSQTRPCSRGVPLIQPRGRVLSSAEPCLWAVGTPSLGEPGWAPPPLSSPESQAALRSMAWRAF